MSCNSDKSRNSVSADMAISEEEIAEVAKEAQTSKAAQEADKTPRIKVNGKGITVSDINRETQYHPASDLFEAKEEAARALVIRELLIQEAVKQNICNDRPTIKHEEEIIEKLLEKEINVPEVTEAACRRYFENNKKKFKTSPLYEVSHILISAPPNKKALRMKAKKQAQELIKELEQNPSKFDALAKEYSVCSSKEVGGHMGQVAHGQTTPNFEKALFQMDKGELSKKPVETGYGFHVIKVHNKVDGQSLEYDDVKDWIADFLSKSTWNRAFSQYIQLIAADADIEGYNLKVADSPLVQ